jgi:hypothetical protein
MNEVDKAIGLFDECMREYSKKQNYFKALAVSKKARSVLGPHTQGEFSHHPLVSDSRSIRRCTAGV